MKLERVRKQWDVETLITKVENGYIKVPEFQRGNVWNIKKKSEAIYSLLTIGLPEIVLLEEKSSYQLLDGLQRYYAISEFINNEYKIRLDKKIDHINGELTETLEGKYFEELPEELQLEILNSEIGAVIYKNVDSFSVAKEIFTRINYKPTPLSQQELLYVLSYDKKKSPILRDWGEKINPRRFKGFGILARVLANYVVIEDLTENAPERWDELFKFKTYYDWLHEWLVEAFALLETEKLEKLAEETIELINLFKEETGIDPTKAQYWLEPIAVMLKTKNGESVEEYWYKIGKNKVQELRKDSEWMLNISQRSRQKPNVLRQRFEILFKYFPIKEKV
jgi:predicted house-cleaning noncanonical NTP pyrophosphatase (MazG superfamily)